MSLRKRNTDKEDVKSCDKYEGRFCAKKEKSVFIVKRKKRRGIQVYRQITEEKVYQTLKVISNSTSVLCRKEEW